MSTLPQRWHPPHMPGPAAEVVLLPHRAVYWSAARSLLIADLHWGKCETFRAGGAPLPQGLLEADLARLDAALRATETARLIILGDLLHAAPGITDWLVDSIAAWRARHPGLEILAIPGNHDRRLAQVAGPWRLAVAEASHAEGPFLLTHDPEHADPGPDRYAWAGHIHPMVTLRGRGDAVRLPCFHLTPAVGILPAFSGFTSGISLAAEPGDEVYAIGPGKDPDLPRVFRCR